MHGMGHGVSGVCHHSLLTTPGYNSVGYLRVGTVLYYAGELVLSVLACGAARWWWMVELPCLLELLRCVATPPGGGGSEASIAGTVGFLSSPSLPQQCIRFDSIRHKKHSIETVR